MKFALVLALFLAACGSSNLYESRHGLLVEQSTEVELVDNWAPNVVDFWSDFYPRDEILAGLRYHEVYFSTETKLEYEGIFYRAYTLSTYSVIGAIQGDERYTESLFKHELGHVVLTAVGIPWDEEIHHQLMYQYKYPW